MEALARFLVAAPAAQHLGVEEHDIVKDIDTCYRGAEQPAAPPPAAAPVPTPLTAPVPTPLAVPVPDLGPVAAALGRARTKLWYRCNLDACGHMVRTSTAILSHHTRIHPFDTFAATAMEPQAYIHVAPGEATCVACGMHVLQSAFQSHLYMHFPSDIPCLLCGHIYANMRSLATHTKKAHNVKLSEIF